MTRRQNKNSDTKQSYEKPRLVRHGDLRELTKAEYGTLSQVLYGSVFSMSSPGFPMAPNR